MHDAGPVIVYSGPRADRIARETGLGIALPPDRWPASVSWPVAGREVVAIEAGEVNDDRVALLARALLDAGALSVRVWRLGLIGRAYRHVWLPTDRLAVAA